jgi:hypothetical protein
MATSHRTEQCLLAYHFLSIPLKSRQPSQTCATTDLVVANALDEAVADPCEYPLLKVLRRRTTGQEPNDLAA